MAMRKDMPFFANARTVCPNPNPTCPGPRPLTRTPTPNPHPSPLTQVRNAIDLARMKSAIRIFNEKTTPGSDGMVRA
eukprot:scaffold6369_cov21-Phaeocystis_antarctica.AAC.1